MKKSLQRFVSVAVSTAVLVTGIYMPGLTSYVGAADNMTISQLENLLHESEPDADGFNLKAAMEDTSQWKNISVSSGESRRFYTEDSANYIDVSISEENTVTCTPSYYYKSWSYHLEDDESISNLVSVDLYGHTNGLAVITSKGKLISEATCVNMYKAVKVDETEFSADYPDAVFTNLKSFEEEAVQDVSDLFGGPINGYCNVVLSKGAENNYTILMDERAKLMLSDGETPESVFADNSDIKYLYIKTSHGNIYKFGTDYYTGDYDMNVFRDITVNGSYPDSVLNTYLYMAFYSGELYAQGDAVYDYGLADELSKASEYGYGRYKADNGMQVTVQNNAFSRPISYGDADATDIAAEDSGIINISDVPVANLSNNGECYKYKTGNYSYTINGAKNITSYFLMNMYYIDGCTYGFIDSDGIVYAKYCDVGSNRYIDSSNVKLTSAEAGSVDRIIYINNGEIIYLDKGGSLVYKGVNDDTELLVSLLNELGIAEKADYIMCGGTLYMTFDGQMYEFSISSDDFIDSNMCHISYEDGVITGKLVKNGISVTDWNGKLYSSDFKIKVEEEGYYELLVEDSFGHKLTKVIDAKSDNDDAREVPTVSAVNDIVYLDGTEPILVSEDNNTWKAYTGPVEYKTTLYAKYDKVGASVVRIVIDGNGQMNVENLVESIDVADRLANFFYIDGDNHLSLISPAFKEYFKDASLPVMDEFGVMYQYTGLDADGKETYNMISDVTSAYTRVRNGSIQETELSNIDSVNQSYGIPKSKAVVYTYIDKAGNIISTDKQYFRTKEHKSEYDKITDGVKTFFINGYNYLMRATGENLRISDEAEEIASNLIKLRGSIQLLNNKYAKVNGNTVEIIGSANKIIDTCTSDGISYRIDENGIFQYKRDGMNSYENVSTDGLAGEYSKKHETVLPTKSTLSADASGIAVIKTKINPGSYRLTKTVMFDSYADAKQFAIDTYGMVDTDNYIGVYDNIGGVNSERTMVFNICINKEPDAEYKYRLDIYSLQQHSATGCNKYGVSMTNAEYDDMEARIKTYIKENPSEMHHIDQYLTDLSYSQDLSDTVSFNFNDTKGNTYFIVDKDGENAFTLGQNNDGKVPISMFSANGVYADGFYVFKALNERLSNQDLQDLKKVSVYAFSGVVYNKDNKNTYKPYYDIYPVFDDTFFNITNPKAYKDETSFVIERASINNSDGSITVNKAYTLKLDASKGDYIKLRFKDYGYSSAVVFGKDKSTGKTAEIQRFNENDMKTAASEENSDIQYMRTSQISLDTDAYDIYVTYTSNDSTGNGMLIYPPYTETFTSMTGNAPKFIACRQLNNNGVDTALLVDENYHVYTYSFDNSNTWTNLNTTLNFGQNTLDYALSDTAWSNHTLSLQTNTYGGKVRNVDVYDQNGNKINRSYTKEECLSNTSNVLSLEDGVLKAYVNGQEESLVTFFSNICGITGASIVTVCGKESVSYNDCVYRNIYNLLENISYTGRFFESDGDSVVLCMDYSSGTESNTITLNTKCDISGNGVYQIKGMDSYGNVYSNTLDVRNIDRLAPDVKVEASDDGFKLMGEDAAATSTDAESGVSKVYYSVGECTEEDKNKQNAIYVPSDSWEEYSGEFLQYSADSNLSKASKNVVMVDAPVVFTYCVDNAGNVSSTHAVTLSGTLNVAHDVVYENGKTTVTFNGSDPDPMAADSVIKFKYGHDKKDASTADSFNAVFTDTSLGEFDVPAYAEKVMPEGYIKKGVDTAKISVISVGTPAISGGTHINIADASVINDDVDATYYRYINLAEHSDFTADDNFNKYTDIINVKPGTYKVEAYTVSADKKIKGDVSSVTLKISPEALNISDSIVYRNGSTDVSFDVVNKKKGVNYSYSYQFDNTIKSGNTYTLLSDSMVTMKAVGDDAATGELNDNIKVVYSGKPDISNVEINGKSVIITAGEIRNDSLAALEYRVDGGNWITVSTDGKIELSPGKHTVDARQSTTIHNFVTESSRDVLVSNLEVYGTQKHYNHKTDLFIADKNNKSDDSIKFSYMDENKVYEQGDSASFTKSQNVTIRDEDSYGNYSSADVNVSVTDTDEPSIGDIAANGDTVYISAGNITNGTLQNIKFKVDTDSSYADYTQIIKLSEGKHTIYAYQEVVPDGQQDSDDIVYSDIVVKEVVVVKSKIRYSVEYRNGETKLRFEDSSNPGNYIYSYTPEGEVTSDGDNFVRKSSGNVKLHEEDTYGNFDDTTVYVTVVHTDAPVIEDPVEKTVSISAGEIKNDKLRDITYRVDNGSWIKGTNIVLSEGTHVIEAYQTTEKYGIVSDVSRKTVNISSTVSNKENYSVRYVTVDGTALAKEKTGNGMLGQLVTEHAKKITGYIPEKETLSLTLTSDDNVITFVYSRCNVTYKVKYVDKDGNKLAKEKTGSALFGDTIYEKAKSIHGYRPLERRKQLKNISSINDNEIVFVYVKEDFSYTIHYQTSDGKLLHSDKIGTVKYKESVHESAVEIKGYSPRKSELNFIVNRSGIEKTFVYNVNSYIYTVKYLDEDNHSIHAQKEASAGYGSAITETALSIEGYEPLTSKQSITIDTDDNEIIFVYRKKDVNIPDEETTDVIPTPTKESKDVSNQTRSNKEAVKTGDSSSTYSFIIYMLIGSAFVFVVARRKRRERLH